MITKELLKSLGFNKEENIPNEESYVRRLRSHGVMQNFASQAKTKAKLNTYMCIPRLPTIQTSEKLYFPTLP